MSPLTIAHYRLESALGAGAMGAVYRAIDTRLNRAVAIKLWQNDDGGTPEAARRMLKEARAASALNHPNIVIVHEFGETGDGSAFIVQELIDGRTLRERLGEPLTLAETVEIGAQVARALAAAHAAGVVHRDIKPENVMLRADGYVKVLDFGIAHLPTVTDGAAMETLANDIIGTPAYMSPEMMNGGEVGPAADVFALGVMLYEMAMGKQPFVAPTAMAVLARIATEHPVSMTTIDPTIPAGLDALVQSMLDKDPKRRPTATEIEHALPAFAEPVDPQMLQTRDASAYTVGRDRQLGQLSALYTRARAGHSTMVGISGEPGIGKSTLLEAFMREVQDASERPTVVRVRCSENLAGSEAFLPVLDALDSLRARGRQSLDALMRSVAPTWHAQLTATTSETDQGRGASAAASQERMKRELRAFLLDASRRAPVVWLIEDLHWADISTIDVLNYVTGRFDGMRVLIVAAFRPSDMTLARHPFLAVRSEMQSRGVYEEIQLGFLTRDDVAHYLALRWPANAFPASFVDEIHSRTEGSPLFMADLVRYLRDTGTIVEMDGVWTVSATRVDTKKDLPESVRGMIARKIERVNDDERKVLLAASVQGQEFDSAALSAALEMDAAQVEESLETLESVHGFVQRGNELEYPDGSLSLRYRFVHVLYQNVLYDSLPPARRVTLCGNTGKALAAHYANDPAPAAGRIAVLFEAARDFATAGQYFYMAAQRAVSVFGFREALGLADRGLAGVAKLAPTPVRHQVELALRMVRGLALRSVRGWAAPELEETFAQARQLCQQLDDPPELFPVMWNLAFFHAIRGNSANVQEHTSILTAHARASGEASDIVAANHLAGVAAEFWGDIMTSSALLEAAHQLHDPAKHEEYSAKFGIDPGMIARAMSARPLWALGFPDRALARSLETIALSRTQREPLTAVFAKIVGAGIHLYRGEAEEAIALGDEIIAACEEYEFAQEVEWGRGFRGAAYCVTGRAELGIAELRSCLAALTSLRSGLARTIFISLLADALSKAGRVDEGLTVIEDGFAYAESSREREFLHEFNRTKGELLRQKGCAGEAEAAFREAIAISQRASAKSFELRAATALARLLNETGRAKESAALLTPLLASFTEGQKTADHLAARTLLTTIQ